MIGSGGPIGKSFQGLALINLTEEPRAAVEAARRRAGRATWCSMVDVIESAEGCNCSDAAI
jgi:hypothetical protein